MNPPDRTHAEPGNLATGWNTPHAHAPKDLTKPGGMRGSKPFIKWAGGKTRLLPSLIPHVPEAFNNYHEPFLGGGAMFFAARDRMAGSAYLSDLNQELVNVWCVVRDSPDDLAAALEWYKCQDSKEFFYCVRKLEPNNSLERAARFVYLNQTAWNGLWRVNRWGHFNVPWGQRSFRGFTLLALRELQASLIDIQINLEDFRDALERVRPGDFVYLDPPYLPLSDTSKFHLYTEKRFREPDLRDLAAICRALTEEGVYWVMSNRDTPLIRDLFGHANIQSLTTRRSVAAQSRRAVEESDSPEVVIVNAS